MGACSLLFYNKPGGEPFIMFYTVWSNFRVFENQVWKFTDLTEESGLHTYKVLWQVFTAGDFNNNGYPDLVATNWGENNFFRTLAGDKPLRIYYGDFNRNRRMDMIVSYYEESAGVYVPMNKVGQ